jgi:hypothetical protein
MAFSRDHGPYNLAYTFRACVAIHDKLSVSSFTSAAVR